MSTQSGFETYGPSISALKQIAILSDALLEGRWLKTVHSGRSKGSSMVITALCMMTILGFSALAVDVGYTMNEKSRVSNAADAAALAGAQELITNPDNANAVACEYLVKNGLDPVDATISIYDSNTKISVTAKRNINYIFARVLGFENADVQSTADAECAPISGVYEGIRPFAIEQQELQFGQQYTLKEGGGSGETGNYGALSLGGSGANNYRWNIVSGYAGHLQVGDLISTEPGNMSGPTVQGITTLLDQCTHSPECTYNLYDPNCPKLVTVVIVDSLDVSGRTDVTIVGFAKFFIEGVLGVGRDSYVIGKFVRIAATGDIDSTVYDYGMKGVRLIK